MTKRASRPVLPVGIRGLKSLPHLGAIMFDDNFLNRLTSNTLPLNEAVSAFQLALQGVSSVVERGDLSASEIFQMAELAEHLDLDTRIGLIHALCAPFFGAPRDSTWAVGVSDLGKHAAVELAQELGPDLASNFSAFATLTNKLA